MKRILLLLCFIAAMSVSSRAQLFTVDTLTYRGDISKYINIVIMGDGYTANQLNAFRTDADSLFNYLFRQAPWSNYKGYFNVFAIRVISAQSGAAHPNSAPDCASAPVPVSIPWTYLGCSFDAYGIHRLMVAFNIVNISKVLAANFPSYDQAFIISNSPYYGGSGEYYATSTVNAYSKEITAHEIGHSFAGLADEYYPGDAYAGERANMTQQSNPALIKWKNWIGPSGVTVQPHCCGSIAASWYKPHTNCKMQVLGGAFCPVCTEAIIENIHSITNPVVRYLPTAATVAATKQFISFRLLELMKPQPNTLKIVWKLDGTVIPGNADSVKINQNPLSAGNHTVSASVTDTSALLRVNNHSTLHVNTITWTIRKTSTGIVLTPAENEITCTIYPNPASDMLNIGLDLAKNDDLIIELLAPDGKLVRRITEQHVAPGKHLNSMDVKSLKPGAYIIAVKVGDYVHTRQWLKQ